MGSSSRTLGSWLTRIQAVIPVFKGTMRNAFQVGVGGIGFAKANPFSIFFTSEVSAAAVAALAGDPATRFTALLDGVVVESFTADSSFARYDAAPFYGFTGIVFNEIRIENLGTPDPPSRPELVGFVRFDTIEYVLAEPDLAMTPPTWTAGQAVTFDYTISGAALNQPATVALYWSADKAFDPSQDRLISGSITTTQTAQTPPGTSVPVHVDATALQNTPPPPGTKYLLAVVDPPDAANPQGQIVESDETNNVQSLALPDISLSSGAVDA